MNNRDKNYTVTKVKKRMEQVDASIARYLRSLATGRDPVTGAPDRLGTSARVQAGVSLEQIPALAERGRLRLQHFFAWLDARLADNEFVCGPHFTIANISGMVAVDFSAWAKLTPPEHLGHLQRWHKNVSTRPSAKA